MDTLDQSDSLLDARVEVPVYTDTWMRGDRYGAIVALSPGSPGANSPRKATVLLDKSGNEAVFVLYDLRVLN